VFSVSLDLGKVTVRLAKMVVWLDQARFNRTGRISVRPRSRGGVKLPTGGDGEHFAKARERPPRYRWGQQIRCDSEADGYSPDGREREDLAHAWRVVP